MLNIQAVGYFRDMWENLFWNEIGINLNIPKSPILIFPSDPIKTLDGFKLPWTIFLKWMDFFIQLKNLIYQNLAFIG